MVNPPPPMALIDNNIQNLISCDGPGYKHMDKQGIVSLLSGDNKKEGVEDVF